jgi:hypothetical protein
VNEQPGAGAPAGGDGSSARSRPDLPEGLSPLGVPGEGDGHHGFVLALAAVVALLGLIFTLGWVVYHHIAETSGTTTTHGQSIGPPQTRH